MTRFKKDTKGLSCYWLFRNGRTYRLTRYTPRNNEFEKGLKYTLWEKWLYQGNEIEYRYTALGKVSSIKEAETLIKTGVY